jgi:hypothetical protein
MSKLLAIAIVAAGAFTMTPAQAAPILSDLPSSTFITIGDLDWTWASPVSSADWYGSNKLYGPTLHAGWRYATETEFANRPQQSAFLDANGVAKQSVAYWNSSFTHIDYSDEISRTMSDGDNHDMWYVRDVKSAVPEPGTWAMMMVGIGAIGVAMRRRQRVTVRFA